MRLIYELPEIPGTELSIIIAEVGSLDDNDVLHLNAKQQAGGALLFGDAKDGSRMAIPNYVEVAQFDVVFHAIDWLKG